MSDLPERICIWEGDRSDPNSTRGWTVSFPDDHPNIYFRASGNTRPAAPVEGLETVGATGVMPGSNGGFSQAVFHSSNVPIGTNLVTRSQAEAIIAAERAEKDAWMKSAIDQQKQAKRLKEHNAVQVARIKELTSPEYLADKLEQVGVVDREWQERAEALETQLAAAREALDFVARWTWRTDPPNSVNKLSVDERFNAIKYHPAINERGEPHRDLAEKESKP